jgi:hypothetical protein
MMTEKSTFFGSKMVYIDDNLDVLNNNLVYYQLPSGEQLDAKTEMDLPPIVYDSINEKFNNHTLTLDLSQSDFQKNNTCSWVMEINLDQIFKDHVFSTLKKYRTFEGIKNEMVLNSNVNSSIYEYINKNISYRYSFSRFELFIKYINLIESKVVKYGNKYDFTVEQDSNKMSRFESNLTYNSSSLTVKFNQEKLASEYAFNYYFNLYYEKI